MAFPQPTPDRFDAALWLGALTTIGGGYALAADRRLTLLVGDVPSGVLSPVLAQIIGQPERQEAIKAAIERRREGEAC